MERKKENEGKESRNRLSCSDKLKVLRHEKQENPENQLVFFLFTAMKRREVSKSQLGNHPSATQPASIIQVDNKKRRATQHRLGRNTRSRRRARNLLQSLRLLQHNRIELAFLRSIMIWTSRQDRPEHTSSQKDTSKK